jgi:23S rRNA (cytidine1920-2'-O)/16S rRNA (cytidine1409-2'-O)-methyltransferase
MRKRADLLLVERGLFESRARAQAAILAGMVRADGAVVRKASETLENGAEIVATAPHPYVSRGGVKLAHALDVFGIGVEGSLALDVGASTGGFTDVLLRRGARRVYAVDTGRGQLHGSIGKDARVIAFEASDIRTLDPAAIPEPVDIVVVDVSFISLALVLAPALAFAGEGAQLVALVKPQFEVGRGLVGRGGIVRDEAARAAAAERCVEHVQALGWHVGGLVDSPIEGGDGNREALLWARRKP